MKSQAEPLRKLYPSYDFIYWTFKIIVRGQVYRVSHGMIYRGSSLETKYRNLGSKSLPEMNTNSFLLLAKIRTKTQSPSVFECSFVSECEYRENTRTSHVTDRCTWSRRRVLASMWFLCKNIVVTKSHKVNGLRKLDKQFAMSTSKLLRRLIVFLWYFKVIWVTMCARPGMNKSRKISWSIYSTTCSWINDTRRSPADVLKKRSARRSKQCILSWTLWAMLCPPEQEL